tara:strand:- start:131 stop:1027 length:897 start_codon:yes stop_codon:yes gene_type:complete
MFSTVVFLLAQTCCQKCSDIAAQSQYWDAFSCNGEQLSFPPPSPLPSTPPPSPPSPPPSPLSPPLPPPSPPMQSHLLPTISLLPTGSGPYTVTGLDGVTLTGFDGMASNRDGSSPDNYWYGNGATGVSTRIDHLSKFRWSNLTVVLVFKMNPTAHAWQSIMQGGEGYSGGGVFQIRGGADGTSLSCGSYRNLASNTGLPFHTGPSVGLLAANTWMHVVVVFTPTEFCMYRDGTNKVCNDPRTTAGWEWDLPDFDNNIDIGTGDGRNTNANYAHISLYEWAFTDNDALNHYNDIGAPLI